MIGAKRPLIMLPYFHKQIASKAIGVYLAALAVVCIVFNRYAMHFSYVAMGLVEVIGFFYLSYSCSKAWARVSEKMFIRNVFWTALALRVASVIFFYFFYIKLTGQPFEFDAADSIGYHGEAAWLRGESWSKVWEYYFHREGVSDSGYGLYLTILYKIFGSGVWIPRLLKALYGSLTVILIYRLTARCLDEKMARLAAIFCAFMPNFIIYCGLHLKEVEMLFLLTAFLERSDYLIRSRHYTFWTVLVPLLLAVSLFFFRTVLGAVAIFSLVTGLLFTSSKVVRKTKRWLVIGWMALAAVVLAGGTIVSEVEGYWEERDANQSSMRQQQTSRGNQWAQYATGTVMAPMMFVLPFSTMVDVDEQYNQQIIHGGNYVRNFMGFFVLLTLVLVIFVNKEWRDLSLVGSYTIAYLAVLSMSGFANAERFLLPAVPGLIVMWAYGVAHLTRRSYSLLTYWMIVVVLMEVGWAYFKLGSRGLF